MSPFVSCRCTDSHTQIFFLLFLEYKFIMNLLYSFISKEKRNTDIYTNIDEPAIFVTKTLYYPAQRREKPKKKHEQ